MNRSGTSKLCCAVPLLVGIAVLVFAASSQGAASKAAGTPPVVMRLTQQYGHVTATYSIVTTPANDPFVIEVSDSPYVDKYGAFDAPNVVSGSGQIGVAPGATRISFRTSQLEPGTYYVHAARDFTTSYIKAAWDLCKILGCWPQFPPDFRAFDWSGMSHVTVQPPCVTPRVVGLKLRRARVRLSTAHCSLGRVKRVESPKSRGIVLAQSSSAGRQLPSGAKVNLVVAA
jgi:hypothetical protein